MYCLHHDDEELIGSDPVPCPFCGYGSEETATDSDELEALRFEDSSTALQHALASNDPPETSTGLRSGRDLQGYW